MGRKNVTEQEYQMAISSATTVPVPKEQWPEFVGDMGGASDVHGVRFEEPRDVTSDDTVVKEAAGSIDVGRMDRELYKSYRYLYVTRNGRHFRFGPFRDVDYGHHRTDPPDL